ncbi:MAG: hypothetical protein HRT90_08430 [Candidatus Margulisbacteria bacterium]|nr:hypothetical protein [Candidatus Margulisiibacteriota bacterium]
MIAKVIAIQAKITLSEEERQKGLSTLREIRTLLASKNITTVKIGTIIDFGSFLDKSNPFYVGFVTNITYQTSDIRPLFRKIYTSLSYINQFLKGKPAVTQKKFMKNVDTLSRILFELIMENNSYYNVYIPFKKFHLSETKIQRIHNLELSKIMYKMIDIELERSCITLSKMEDTAKTQETPRQPIDRQHPQLKRKRSSIERLTIGLRKTRRSLSSLFPTRNSKKHTRTYSAPNPNTSIIPTIRKGSE